MGIGSVLSCVNMCSSLRVLDLNVSGPEMEINLGGLSSLEELRLCGNCVVKGTSGLRTLHLSRCKVNNFAFGNFVGLKVLSLGNCMGTFMMEMRNVVFRLIELRLMNWGGVFDGLGEMSELRVLSIEWGLGQNKKSGKFSQRCLGNLPVGLNVLRLGNMNIGGCVEKLGRLMDLRELYLIHCTVDGWGWGNYMSKLEKLDLSNSTYNCDKMYMLRNVVGEMVGLRYLGLNGFGCTKESMAKDLLNLVNLETFKDNDRMCNRRRYVLKKIRALRLLR